MSRAKPIDDPGLAEAVRVLGFGAKTKIGEACGVSSQAVSDWPRIPPHHVITIEALTGVPRERLRPDIYGAPRPRPQRTADGAAAA